jgi:hypothetical protein
MHQIETLIFFLFFLKTHQLNYFHKLLIFLDLLLKFTISKISIVDTKYGQFLSMSVNVLENFLIEAYLNASVVPSQGW